MSGLSSYPRTDGMATGDIVPVAAYSNVPEPLRSRLIARARGYRRRFVAEFPERDFLAASYLDTNDFKGAFRDDDQGKLFREPGAVPGHAPSLPQTLDANIDQSDPRLGGLLTKRNIASFAFTIRLATNLRDDDLVWRFIGANYSPAARGQISIDRFTCNRIDGGCWGVGHIPTTEDEWRSTCAIPGIWNGDGGYVAFRVGDLPASVQAIFRSGLIGAVGPQASMVPDYYFPGGATQLVVDVKSLIESPDAQAFLKSIPLQRSAWNQP